MGSLKLEQRKKVDRDREEIIEIGEEKIQEALDSQNYCVTHIY